MDNKIPLSSLLGSPAFKGYDNSWVRPPTPAEKLPFLKDPAGHDVG
jgi:hypothetical protein